MKGFSGMKSYQDRQRKFVMKYGFILLNPFSQHKAYIYDFDQLVGARKRMVDDFWIEYRGYKGQENKLPKPVVAQLFQKFSSGIPLEECVGVYTYKVKKSSRKGSEGEYETKEAYVGIEDVYVWPVKHYFKRKSASEKQSINYPCQGRVCALNKSHKFGEGCDANTEPSLIVILRRCND